MRVCLILASLRRSIGQAYYRLKSLGRGNNMAIIAPQRRTHRRHRRGLYETNILSGLNAGVNQSRHKF